MSANPSLIGTLILFLGLLACGGGKPVPDLRASDAWARPMSVRTEGEAPIPGSHTSVYLEILNRGKTPDLLLGGETGAAAEVEVHESYLDGDIARMRRVDSLELPPGERVVMRPGGVHIMLLDLRHTLREGDTLPLTLTFKTSSPLLLRVPVRGSGGS